MSMGTVLPSGKPKEALSDMHCCCLHARAQRTTGWRTRALRRASAPRTTCSTPRTTCHAWRPPSGACMAWRAPSPAPCTPPWLTP
jgi:hypothetical protein